jgi:hypothetical protein
VRLDAVRVWWAGFAAAVLLVAIPVGLASAAPGASSPGVLKSDILVARELGNGWSGPSGVKATSTTDTWSRPTCWTYSTQFGGPYVRAYFTRSSTSIANIEEQIFAPSASAKAVFQMMDRCGLPKGVPPHSTGGARLVPTQPISLFDGLGQASSGSLSRPFPDQRIQSIYGVVVKGRYLVTFGYTGSASLSQVHRWAVAAVARVP